MEKVFSYLKSVGSVPERLRKDLVRYLRKMDCPKRHFLKKSGSVCQYIYFVENGLFRRYYEKGNESVSVEFYKENQVCVCWDSFFNQRIDRDNLQAMEESEVWYLGIMEFNRMMRLYPEFKNICITLLDRCIRDRQDMWFSLWRQTAIEKFEWLYKHSPDLILRVPAKYLASYIDMTEVTFSVVKKG